MDPVTAFSLAAGVLQVVDLSFKALARCQELYKDGSLAEHRSTEEIARYLVDTIDRLKASVNRAPRPKSQDDRDIIEISTKCSSTAAELLTELEKLKLDSRGGLRQVIKKSVRAIRRAKFVKEVQNKLEKYQRTLDTCILARLDARSIQNRRDFQSLDQSVRDLVFALDQGYNTVAQLLVDQNQDLRAHIDRKLDDRAKVDCDLLAQKQFIDSIFFPEILSRQEQIPTAYRGTCRWIFHPPNTRSGSAGDTDPNNFSSPDSDSLSSSEIQGKEIHENTVNEHGVEYDNVKADDSHRLTGGSKENRRGSGDGRNDYVRSPPWSSFVNWLEYGHGVYWINGKAGSGKSTLMNYITGERRTKKALTDWASSDLLVVSFFFWNPGTGLQKSSQGLLRSLLYQIAHQRKDLTSIMIDRPSRSAKSFDGFFNPAQPHTWTEQRLLSVLRQFLVRKPSSLWICFFIDGLDEFTGEEDIILEIVRLLKDTPQAKLCVSSRPELTFQQEFRASPQLRLQDLNREDIKRMATDKLYPVLKQSFPQMDYEFDEFIRQVCGSAQGVFLWLDIVIKDIIKGARSADTMHELHARLQTMPDTVEGLYTQMLNRLDKLYLQEAFQYFHLLMAESGTERQLTLLDLVCTQTVPWEHVLENDLLWFNSAEFHRICENSETRILTRCAGLVEIGKHQDRLFPGVAKQSVPSRGPPTWLSDVPTSQEEQNVVRHLRGVHFIHRTVIDYLKGNHQVFFQDPNWHSAANYALARGQLGLISIVPTAISEEHDKKCWVTQIDRLVMAVMVSLDSIDRFRAPEEPNLALDDVTTQMVDHIYQVISQVDVSLNGPNHKWHKRYDPAGFGEYQFNRLSVHDCPGFAAFFGRHSYVSRHLTLHNCPLDELNYLLACTIIGLRCRSRVSELVSFRLVGALTTIEVLLHRGADPNLPLRLRDGLTAECTLEVSAWGAFLYATPSIFGEIELALGPRLPWERHTVNREQNLHQAFPWLPIWNTVMKHFLSCSADKSTSVFSIHRLLFSNGLCHELVIEESPLLCLERLISTHRIPIVIDHFRQLTDILRSQGAPERRRCRLIHFEQTPEVFDPRVPKTIYEISENRSDRFWKGWLQGLYDEREKPVKELKADLTEDNVLYTSDLILKSSFRSGRRATI